MKRILTVLAVALILAATLFAPASSRQTPWSYQGPEVDPGNTDDHPWGGEQEFVGTNPFPQTTSLPTNAPTGPTGYILVDLLFNRLTLYLMEYRADRLIIEGSNLVQPTPVKPATTIKRGEN